MKNNPNFNTGLLFITYLLMDSDQEISENELNYLDSVRKEAGVSDDEFRVFYNSVIGKTEREIYQIGMEAINLCSDPEKIQIFVKLYGMALADEVLRVKEVRFILYATRMAEVSMERVIEMANEVGIAVS
jgi:ribosomal protein L12E/L44/L45/RPP1/RPP2